MNFSDFEQLLEIGDGGSVPLKWEYDQYSDFTYTYYYVAYSSKDVSLKYDVEFQNVGMYLKGDDADIPNKNKIFALSFLNSDTGLMLTGENEVFPLMSAILEITKEFIKKHKPSMIFWEGVKGSTETGDVSKRNKLYLPFLEKQIKKLRGAKYIRVGDKVFIVLKKDEWTDRIINIMSKW